MSVCFCAPNTYQYTDKERQIKLNVFGFTATLE